MRGTFQRMPTLRELADVIQQRPGVHAVVILGADGLVIEAHDPVHDYADALAARVPAIATAARQLGDAADTGTPQTIVLEFEHGYGVIIRLSDQASLLVSAANTVALGDLLFDLRQHRTSMAKLL